MTPHQLRNHIRALPEHQPRTIALEAATQIGTGHDNAWYRSQQEHWLGWLREYGGPGAYGRSDVTSQKDAAYVYNHIQCAPMLFWLAEALDMPETDLQRASHSILAAPAKGASQCKALRQIFPWAAIAAQLATKHPAPSTIRERVTNRLSNVLDRFHPK